MKLKWQPKSNLERTGLKIIHLLKAGGFEAFFVGGVVRNTLLKRKSDNLDIATGVPPNEVEKILDRAWIKYKPVGKRYGTILAVSKDGPIEITTFRSEGRYSDKRHPDQVQFVKDYLDDAKRRDFTINSLYLDPVKGKIYDPTGGLKDLKNKIIKFVGDPGERIKEDPLRLLRAVRLAAQLGFNMNNSAAVSITRNSRLLLSVPGERLKQELDKIMLSKRPAEGITLLDQLGLIKFLIPELLETKSFSHKSKNYHLEGTIYKHTLLAVDKAKHEELDLLYALLFHDIGKPRTAKKVVKSEGVVISTRGHAEVSADIFNKFAKKLRFPSNATKQVDWIIRNHMHFVDFYGMKIRKQMELAAHPSFELLLKHWDYDERANIRKIYLDQFHKKYLSSMKAGKDLLHKLKSRSDLIKKLSFGKLIMRYIDLKPGPALGGKIQDVKARILQGEIKNKRDLKAYLKS